MKVEASWIEEKEEVEEEEEISNVLGVTFAVGSSIKYLKDECNN